MTVDRIKAAATRPVDIASLAAFRIIFGAVMFVGILRFLATGWIEAMYGEPHWFFTYPGFDWVTPWPVHRDVRALRRARGARARDRARLPTTASRASLFALGFAYTQLIDVTNYLNHHYLVVLLGVLLACLPANARVVARRASRSVAAPRHGPRVDGVARAVPGRRRLRVRRASRRRRSTGSATASR